MRVESMPEQRHTADARCYLVYQMSIYARRHKCPVVLDRGHEAHRLSGRDGFHCWWRVRQRHLLRTTTVARPRRDDVVARVRLGLAAVPVDIIDPAKGCSRFGREAGQGRDGRCGGRETMPTTRTSLEMLVPCCGPHRSMLMAKPGP